MLLFKCLGGPIKKVSPFSFAGDVSIYTTEGKKVHQSKISSTEQKLSLPNLASGVYFVNFTGRNQTGTRRLYIR